MYELLDLFPRDEIVGPAIIMNGTSTCVIEPECVALVTGAGDLEITVDGMSSSKSSSSSKKLFELGVDEDDDDFSDEVAFSKKSPILCSFRYTTIDSWVSQSKWDALYNARRYQPTSKSVWIFRVRFSPEAEGWSLTRRTCPFIWAQCPQLFLGSSNI